MNVGVGTARPLHLLVEHYVVDAQLLSPTQTWSDLDASGRAPVEWTSQPVPELLTVLSYRTTERAESPLISPSDPTGQGTELN